MRQTGTWLAFVGLFFLACGCGGQPSGPVSKAPSESPRPKGDGFGAPSLENRPAIASAGGAAPAPAPAAPASGTSSPPSPPAFERPTIAIGGGGAPAPAAGGAPAGGNPANINRPGGNSGSGVPLGLANGLYPQGLTGSAGGGGGGVAISGSLMNGLYPQFISAAGPSSGGAMTPAPASAPPVAAAAVGDTAAGSASAQAAGAANEFFEAAKSFFAAGEEDAASQQLYAYLLAKDDAFEQYPLQWFPGLKQPRSFLRIGIGVTYTARDFKGKPPVIGDPVASDRGGGRRGNPPPGGGDDVAESSGAGSGAGGTGNSPYGNVDTSTPAGFLLYYTGDYVEKLYQELNTRRKGNQAQFGKLLAQFPERVPSANAQNANAQPTPPPGAAPPNRPTIGVGGGPPGGGGGVGGGDGGNSNNANRGARGARKLVEQWSGSTATAPERLTTGTLTPGVLCLGEGKKDELFTRAKKSGVDVLLLFDVKVAEARGENYSTTTLRLFNVDNPDEQLALGRQLRNNTVMEARENKKADPVEAELSRILEDYMDQNLVATELPKSLTQENVTKRIDAVLADKNDNPLKAAVEVLGFYRVGLLPEDKTTEALKQLLGEDAADAVLNGEEADRVKVLRDLVKDD